jgi:hypothetical protein
MKKHVLLIVVSLLLMVVWITPVAAQDTGSISGTLTDSTTGVPIGNVNVMARGVDVDGYGMTYTRDDGSYTIHLLPAGTYEVGAGNWADRISDYVLVWWPGVSDELDAREVTVTAGEQTTGIALATQIGGTVTGSITDAWTGAPIGHVWVDVEKHRPYIYGDWSAWGYEVGADGTFRAGGLSGEYRLRYHQDGDYLPAESEPFTIGPGQELTIALSVTPAYGTPLATVAGTACEVDGTSTRCWTPDPEDPEGGTIHHPLAGVAVEARTPDGTLLGTTTSDPWGWFQLENLNPGTIIVSASPPAGMRMVGSLEYDLGPNEGVWDAELMARRLEVRHGLTSRLVPDQIGPGEQAELIIEAVFAGTAGSLAPFDVTDVVVAVHLPEGVDYVGHVGDGPYDVASGLWTIPRLPYMGRARMTITVTVAGEGTFRLNAEIAGSDWPDLSAAFGDGRGDDFTSETLEVLIVEPAPVEEAVIGGVVWKDADGDGVRDPDELGLGGVTVVATLDDGSSMTSVTSSDGTYRLTTLPAGSYTVTLEAGTLPAGLESADVFVVELEGEGSFLGADFGCVEVAGSLFWWIGGTAVLVLAGASVFAWLMTRKRPTPATVEEETTVEEALV